MIAKKTPSGKTGVTRAEKLVRIYRIDWLQGTFPSRYFDKVIFFVTKFLDKGEFEELHKGLRYFERAFRHSSGAILGLGKMNLVGGADLAYLELSGSVLGIYKQSRLRKLMRILRKKFNFKCTRIDLCIDDFSRSLNIYQIKRATDKLHYVGFGDTVKFIEFGRKGSRGLSISFGRRGSSGGGKYLVIYDKGLESKGKIDSIRVELSCYDRYAVQSFDQFCDLPYLCWGDIILGWISGAIDFRRRKDKDDTDPGRRPRLPWWKKFVSDAVPLKPSFEYKPDSLERIKNWFHSQIAPSLCVLMNGLGKEDVKNFWDFFWEVVIDGESRLKDKHRYLIAMA